MPAPQPITVATCDGVRLSGLHRTGRPEAAAGLALVLGHGFTNHGRTPAFQRIAHRLTRYGAVVACDFRGHGGSTGWSTVGGDAELLDLDAVVGWARAAGYHRVASIGLSMGGAVVMRHAAVHGGVDAVVSVSAVSRWYVRDTVAMRRVHFLLETGAGRWLCRRVLRTRLGRPWLELPSSPVEVVHRIAPTPLLIVHGDHDSYFPVEHPYALARAAGPSAELLIVPGFGHAESGLRPDLVDRIGHWVLETLGDPVNDQVT
ncbi:alpha/beta fold hydrolase [soil metagenome]